MKKLSKLALLAAAATLMLAGMAGCFTSVSDDDDTQQTTGGSTGTGGSGSTGTTGGSVTVDAAWDFKSGANASKNAVITAFGTATKKLDTDEVITPDSGSGATLTIIADSNNTVKYNSGIQQGTKTAEANFAKLKVDGACTVTITAKGASSSLKDGNINSFSINGTNKFKSTENNLITAEQTATYTATGAETIEITATGMKFLSIVCSQ